MLDALAALVLRRPRALLAAVGVAVVAAAGYGHDAASHLSPAGYEVPGSDSTRAAELLGRRFDTGAANVVLLVRAGTDEPGGVDGPTAAADGRDLAAALAAEPGVADVRSYWDEPVPALRSADGSAALITARIVADEEAVYDRVERLRRDYVGSHRSLDVALGGSALMNLEVVEESERDLLRAELIAIPATTIIMLIVFRGVVAALLPLIVSAVAVTGTAASLKLMSEATLVSIFALNLTTALGLGMGVDFSLFLLSRWREERARGLAPDAAVAVAVRMAGRSILFSGLTTAATLAALLLFDYPLLRSLAVAGFVVVVLATFGALIALPSAMVVLGTGVERWRLGRPNGDDEPTVEDGRWYRFSVRIMRRPLVAAAAATALLVLLGLPFLRAQFGIPDDRVLPASSPARIVADEIRASFDAREFAAAVIVAPDFGPDPAVEAYALAVSSIDGVGRVDAVTGSYGDGIRIADPADPDRFRASAAEGSPTDTWLSVVPSVEPISPEAETMVQAIRALPASSGVLVGGEPGRLVDNKAEIRATAPWVMAWIAVAVFVLLHRAFGSVLLPVKAFVLNLLSLTAAFGAIVWIFQDGRLSGLLGFTPTGLIDAQTPILIFCIAFGLSMDYEVFLLSRIKEEWDATGDQRRAVAVGLERTGRIITAAAVLMAVVFLAFASGRVTFIQMVGIGLALAIVMDATLVRSVLVPAFMVIAGRWNWWSPSMPTIVRRPAYGRENP